MCNDCNTLRCRLQQLDFALHDMVLYLDSHPTCQQGLCYYRQLRDQRDAVKSAYIVSCGPLLSCEGAGDCCWTWVENPWPWEWEG